MRQRSFPIPILRCSRIRNAPECSGRRGDKIGRQYRLPDRETPHSWLVISRSNCPVAEAPCKQTAQVGESITTTRIEDAEPLNAVFRGVRLPDEKLTRDGCPLGVECPP